MLQASWEFAFCTAEVRPILAVISCIIFIVEHLRHWGQVGNPSNISFRLFHWRLEYVCREACGVSPRLAGRRLRLMSRAGRCELIDWMISQAVLEALLVHLKMTALVLGTVERGTFGTCHNHLGAGHILAMVAHHLDVLGLRCG